MSRLCDSALTEMGGGIAAALRAVDCLATDGAAGAFGRIFAPGGALEVALVILLTLYVSLFAISLMLGRSNLSVRALLPRMIVVGMVLAFSTSWVAFRSFIWPLFVETPDYLATLLTGSDGSATLVFAEKLDVVFAAVQNVSQGQESFEAFSPPGLMWLGAIMLLLGTVGILVTARIALAVLVALGPLFVVMALFNGTRGLFTGWLKGLAMLALAPLFAVLGGTIMLELAVPVLAELGSNPGTVEPRAAMAFFLVGAVHLALMAMAIKVAATIVAGWSVFGLAERAATAPGSAIRRPDLAAPAHTPARLPRDPGASAAARSADGVGRGAGAAANGAEPHGGGRRLRETRVYATSAPPRGEGDTRPTLSRTRGVGNRFRSASTRALPRKPEFSQ